MKKTYVAILLFHFVANAFAQLVPDSLIDLINKDIVPKEKCQHLMVLASYYMGNQKQKADSCLQTCLELATNTNEKGIVADVKMMFGNEAYVTGEYDQALEWYLTANKEYTKLNIKPGIATSLMNIGLIYINEGNLGKGLEYELKAAKYYESSGGSSNLGYAYNAIAVIYKEKKDYKKAIIYQEKSLKNNLKFKVKIGVTNNYINLGSVYSLQKKYTKAKDCFNRAISLAEKRNDETSLSNAYHELAMVFFDEEEFERCGFYLDKALKIQDKNNDQQGKATTLTSLGKLYLQKKEFEKAIQFSLDGIKLSYEIKSKAVEESAHLILSQAFIATNDFQNAHHHLQLYTRIKDSIQDLENKQNLLELQEKYHAENTEKALLEFQNKEVKNELSNQKERNFRNLTLGGLLLVSIICVVFIYRNRMKQKSNSQIQEAYSIIRQKQKETIESINYAKRLQEAILPPDNSIKEFLPQSFVYYLPKDIVAGDFYFLDHIDLGNGNTEVIIAAADCTGHGVPGAMVSVVCSNALHRAVKEFGISEPGKILDKVRELVIETFSSHGRTTQPNESNQNEVKDGMDISICCLELNNKRQTSNHKLKWAGANNPLWLIRNNELQEFKPNKQPIGKIANPHPFTTHEILLEPNDCLYIFTDGFEDQFGGEKGKKLMASKMKNLFLQISHLEMSAQMEKIKSTFFEWKEFKSTTGKTIAYEQVDDVCIIGIKIY